MGDPAPTQQGLQLKMPPAIGDKPYLDSSVFLAHLKAEKMLGYNGKPRGEIASNILEDARQGKYVIHTSFITLAEVRRLRKSKQELNAAELVAVNTLFAEFLEHEWILPIEVNRDVAEMAQALGAQYGIWPMDAIHLASAVLNECGVLLVWDKTTFTGKCPANVGRVQLIEPYWQGLAPVPNGRPKLASPPSAGSSSS